MRKLIALTAALAAALITTPAVAERPAPELTAAFPADQEAIEGPLSEITLIFAAETDLVEVAIMTPDQRRLVLHDAFNGSEQRQDSMFVLSLPEAVTRPGTYLIEISASVTDPTDGSASALSAYTSFIITEAAADAEPTTPGPERARDNKPN